MTEWSVIEPRFTRLRDFVLNDLEGFGGNKEGGNFALVGLVLSACDALGTLRYDGRGSGGKIFERCLPDEWKPVADILYEALRNGLIHTYDAKLVVDDVAPVSFAIGWYEAMSDGHMKFITPERTILYIQAQRLVASLRDVFDDVEEELRRDARLRDDFHTRDRKDRVVVVHERDAERWRTAVGSARIAHRPEHAGTPTYLPAGATGPMGP